jgi:flagellar protein FliS
MVPNNAARAYARIGLETGVAAANPHRLILMLFDGAIAATADAAAQLAENRIAGKGKAISNAIRIIEEGLKASLDPEGGGEIAESLGELYDYMSRRLLLSSLRNDVAGLAEVTRLLTELREAWAAIGTSPEAIRTRASAQTTTVGQAAA